MGDRTRDSRARVRTAYGEDNSIYSTTLKTKFLNFNRGYLLAMAVSKDDKKPDILMIISDQHNASITGCYGDPIVKTPNLDRLASDGVLFERAYCSYPVCGPSRQSFFTGRYPYDIRCWDNKSTLASDIPTFAHALGIAGYEVVLNGRAHWHGPDQLHGFEDRLVGDINESYWGRSYDRWVKVGDKTYLVDGIVQRLGITHFSGPGGSQYQEFDKVVNDAALKFLKSRSEQHDRRPFCLAVAYMSPHHWFTCPPEDYQLYEGKIGDALLPGDHPESLHPFNRNRIHNSGFELIPKEDVIRSRTAYYGLVTFTDRMIGQLLQSLEKYRLKENTLILYFSDHGEMAGEHGMWWKHTFYEGASRVPFIVSFPGRFPEGKRLEHLISLVDLFPSLCDWTGAPPPPGLAGSSLHGLIQGEKQGEGMVFSELYIGKPMRMVRKGPWKYNFYYGEAPELFNLEEDPGEFRNLAGDAKHRNLCKELENLVLDGWNPEEISSAMREEKERVNYLKQWTEAVNPPDPGQWEGMKPSFPEEWKENATSLPEYVEWKREREKSN